MQLKFESSTLVNCCFQPFFLFNLNRIICLLIPDMHASSSTDATDVFQDRSAFHVYASVTLPSVRFVMKYPKVLADIMFAPPSCSR